MFWTSTGTLDCVWKEGQWEKKRRKKREGGGGRGGEGGKGGGAEMTRGRGQACTCKEWVIVWQSHSSHTNGGQWSFWNIAHDWLAHSHTLTHSHTHILTPLPRTPLHRHWLTARAHLPPSGSTSRPAERSSDPGSPWTGWWSPRPTWTFRWRNEDCLWPQSRAGSTHITGTVLYTSPPSPPAHTHIRRVWSTGISNFWGWFPLPRISEVYTKCSSGTCLIYSPRVYNWLIPSLFFPSLPQG